MNKYRLTLDVTVGDHNLLMAVGRQHYRARGQNADSAIDCEAAALHQIILSQLQAVDVELDDFNDEVIP